MIRVAYDATVLVDEFGQLDRKYGIFRVTEEIMQELSKRDDIELVLACNSNSALEAINFSFCIENDLTWQNYKYIDVFRSRLVLRKMYEKYYLFLKKNELVYKLPRYSIKSIGARSILKLIRAAFTAVSRIDYYSSFEYEKFDIFHSIYPKLPAKEITKNTPRVLTIHDLIPIIRPNLVNSSLTRSFQEIINSIDKQKDWVICVSEYTRQEFCEYTGMLPERTFVTPLASASHFHPVNDPSRITEVRQRYHIPEGNYFLSLATHLAPHKNLDHLIHCFFRLLSEHPDIDINLVLAGSNRFRRVEDIKDHDYPQFTSRIVYTGFILDEDLSAIYSGATAFIFPSLYEGFGLPPLEAMQCGTPVITSNKTSLPEVVGDAGIMVDPKDEDALCQAMFNLLNNNTLSEELRRKGLEQAKKFSWGKCAADTAEVYKKIVESQ